MIILDTNVISEPLRKKGSADVRAWLNAQHPESLYTTTLNLAELYAGIAVLPAGRKRSDLAVAVRSTIARLFAGRILGFDEAAAESYAAIAEGSRAGGLTVPYDDALIAAIAKAHGCTIATRNVSNFAGADVKLVNPWETADPLSRR